VPLLKALLSLVAPLTIGASIVHLSARSLRSSRLLYWITILSTGFGFDALLFFWFRRAFIVVEWLLVAASVVLIRYLNKRPKVQEQCAPSETNDWWLRLLLIGATVTSFAYYVYESSKSLHGEWDAWAIWNLHARVLFRGGPQWLSTLRAISFSNPDYPLLLPSLIARFWRFTASETTLVPISIAFLFTGLSAVALFGFTQKLQGGRLATIATLSVLGTPFFLRHGADQYSDLPLGFFVLTTLGLVWLYEESSDRPAGLLILAGFHAGLACWTKNEGFLFVIVVCIAYVAASGWELRSALAKLQWFALGAAPGVGTTIYFHAILSKPDVIFAGQNREEMIARVLDLHRHAEIIASGFNTLWGFGRWYLSPVPVLFLWVILHNFGKWNSLGTGFRVTALALIWIPIGYYGIYLITPLDLTYHIESSLNRLFLQLWPASLMLIFVMMGRPVKAASRIRWQLVFGTAVMGLAIAVWSDFNILDRSVQTVAGHASEFIPGPASTGYFILVPESERPRVVVRVISVETGSSFAVTPTVSTVNADVRIESVLWRDVAIALVNPNPEPEVIQINLLGHDANVAAVQVKLDPGRQMSAFLGELFSMPVTLNEPESTLSLQSSSKFSALVLQKKENRFKPMQLDATDSNDSQIVFPQVIFFGGWITEVLLFNPSQMPSTGKIRFFHPDHRKWTVRLNGIENDTFTYTMNPGTGLRYSPAS
jgi:4-amino-4-deoxy-L-arabinose transferase-like glycosyltransferase